MRQLLLQTIIYIFNQLVHQSLVRVKSHLHGLRVGQIDEGCLVRLDLDVGPFLQVHVPEDDLRALFNAKIVHHPDWYMAHAFLRRKFEDTAVSLDAHLRV